MALATLKGGEYLYPTLTPIIHANPVGSGLDNQGAMTAATHSVAFIGPVGWEAGDKSVTKSLVRVQFLVGARTAFPTGEKLRISLQDVDAATGQPYRPDGTQDQTYDILDTDTFFVASTWYRQQGDFSAARTVSHGEMLAVVFTWQVFTTGSISFRFWAFGSGQVYGRSGLAYYTASWATLLRPSTLVLEFNDGTLGYLGMYTLPLNVINSVAINTGTNPMRVGNRIKLPFAAKCTGLVMPLAVSSSAADFKGELYDSDGTTLLATATCDAMQTATVAAGHSYVAKWDSGAEITLSAGVEYYYCVTPTTATSLSGVNVQFFSADLLSVIPGGTDCVYVTSPSGTPSWTPTTTKRFAGCLILSALSDNAGGGGMIVHPGMTGGIRG